MTITKTLFAICKREYLDHRVGFFWVPTVIAGLGVLMLLLSILAPGDWDINGKNLGEFIAFISTHDPSKENVDPAKAVAIFYWSLGAGAVPALPFVIYFTLSAALYDERKDRSILFLKSMPVADWQEVLGKLLTICLFGPVAFMVVLMAFQLIVAFIVSATSLAYGGAYFIFWPLFEMLQLWVSASLGMILWFLWALPVLAWVLLISAISPKVPFMLAVIPLFVIVLIELQYTGHSEMLSFLGTHLGDGMAQSYDLPRTIKGPDELVAQFTIGKVLTAFGASFATAQLWIGIILAGAFFFGASEMRRRGT